MTILAGESGASKSTLLADIAARETTGNPWPGDPPEARRTPGRVLWLGSEDSTEEMTVPRLRACGADLDNVVEITGASVGGKVTTFSMQDDLDSVRVWLSFARNEGRPFHMLVIDPITSYLPGQKLRKVDLNDAGQLRSILEPWLRLADEFSIAIVCVTHFGKDTTRSMLHRVLGSAAFAQTCRSLCAVVQRPASAEGSSDPHAKALIQVKANLPEHPGGAWCFTTEVVEVGRDERNGKPIVATRPRWEALDPLLTSDGIVGKSRGPVSDKSNVFGLWLKTYFARFGAEAWAETETVLAAAVSVGVTQSWWNKHSSEFLQKRIRFGEAIPIAVLELGATALGAIAAPDPATEVTVTAQRQPYPGTIPLHIPPQEVQVLDAATLDAPASPSSRPRSTSPPASRGRTTLAGCSTAMRSGGSSSSQRH